MEKAPIHTRTQDHLTTVSYQRGLTGSLKIDIPPSLLKKNENAAFRLVKNYQKRANTKITIYSGTVV